MPIRFAEKNDLTHLVGLLQQLFALEPDFPFDAPTHTRGLSLLLESPDCRVVIAEESGHTIGMASLQPHISTAFGCKDAILEDLVVDRLNRGKGWGHALHEFILTEAKSMGYNRVRLWADRQNNNALAFYHRHGWKTGRMTQLYLTF